MNSPLGGHPASGMKAVWNRVRPGRMARFPGGLAGGGLRGADRVRSRRREDPAAREATEALADELLLVLQRPRGAACRARRPVAREEYRGSWSGPRPMPSPRPRPCSTSSTAGWTPASSIPLRVRDPQLGAPVAGFLAEVAGRPRPHRGADRMLMRFGHDEIGADVRARTIYLVQIGYISMQRRGVPAGPDNANAGVREDLHRRASATAEPGGSLSGAAWVLDGASVE